ncbi:hypothetical protein [uncultured Bartonella sp.]|uniref:hypothetical protein n=1 Tax=uncultured Bartonella sp. TaxID=104108 RepID=UPI0025FFAC32|nr:hypothetical protein [uncultured Bartonella sp.]
MSDLTPEQERKIALAFLGRENFERYEDAKKKKYRFKPEKVPPLRAEFFNSDHSSWTLEIKRGNEVVKLHKYLDERTIMRMVKILRRKDIPVRRFYFDWERKDKTLKQPSRTKSIISRIGKLKY